MVLVARSNDALNDQDSHIKAMHKFKFRIRGIINLSLSPITNNHWSGALYSVHALAFPGYWYARQSSTCTWSRRLISTRAPISTPRIWQLLAQMACWCRLLMQPSAVFLTFLSTYFLLLCWARINAPRQPSVPTANAAFITLVWWFQVRMQRFLSKLLNGKLSKCTCFLLGESFNLREYRSYIIR